jgi:hypothetical protein
MRTLSRVLVFDIVAPLAAIGALLMIGVELDWPLWWVSVCTGLCLLIGQGMIVNFVLAHKDRVTVGTDHHGPGLRLAVVALTTAALVAATLVGYGRWTQPDRERNADTAEVVRISTAAAEATATITPADPTSSIDQTATQMAPEQAQAYKKIFGSAAADLANKNISSQATTAAAGVEAISDDAASVAVIMHTTQSSPGSPPQPAVVPMRVTLSKRDEKWQVFDVTPINPTTSEQNSQQRGDQSEQPGADQSGDHN